MSRRRGVTVIELLVGMTLSLLVLGALTGIVAAGGRLLTSLNRRAELEDTAQLATEAFGFDVRDAGYDPRAAGFEALSEAAGDRLTLLADLDADGVVDPASEETIAYRCDAGSRRLSRLVGRQSMPLADDVTTCRFTYHDASGLVLAVPPGGLAAADRGRVRSIGLDLALRPRGVGQPSGRVLQVALRRST
jgi:Tfp pilus assembly protein PilW